MLWDLASHMATTPTTLVQLVHCYELVHAPSFADAARMEDVTRSLLERIQRQQEAAAHISQLQALCGGDPPVWAALGEVASDVDMKAALWRGLREWKEASESWVGQRLFGLDVQAMEDQVSEAL